MTDQVTDNQEQAAPEAPKPELNLNDLSSMRSLIDIVTQRGAFKANELSSVGILYDKINAFLEAAQAAAAAQPAPEGE
jgi:hypothetical protein